MNVDDKYKVLVLAPHTDDGELGCGGSIAKLINDGHQVYYVAFSSCKKSLPKGMDENTLIDELNAATKILGIPSENVIVLNFDVRRFKYDRQDILEQMIEIRNKIQPSLVFLPCSTDIHQDHQVVYEEGVRAFKQTSILGYEMPWNNVSMETTSFIKLTERDVNYKVAALKEYKSQKHRGYLNTNFITSLATIRGVQIGATYAEAFEVVRWIM